MELKVIQYL